MAVILGLFGIFASIRGTTVIRPWAALLALACITGLPTLRGQSINNALDNESLTFTTAGTWTTGNFGADGVDCVFAGPGTAALTLELRTTVSGPGWLVFWKYLSSGNSALLVDGVVVRNYNSYSSTGWSQDSWQITAAGPHEIIWRVLSGGYFRLDGVSWVPDLTIPLESALPGAVWTTGGTHPWTGVLAPARYFSGAAVVNLPCSATQNASGWIETTFTGPGRLSYNAWNPWGAGPPAVFVNGFEQNIEPGSLGAVGGFLPPGPHTIRWQFGRGMSRGGVNDVWQPYLENVVFIPASARPLAEVLNTPGLTWVTGGDAPWDGIVLDLPDSSSDVNAAFSGFLQPGQESWLETTVIGPGTISTGGYSPAWWYDVQFMVDGAVYSTRINSGSVRIGPGVHQVRLRVDAPAIPPATHATFARMSLDYVSWIPQTGVPLADALDVEGVTLTVSSPADVFSMTNANDGSDDGIYLRTGGTLTATVTGPAALAWTKSAGTLSCTLDGLVVTTNSGAGPTNNGTLEIPAGTHQVKWTAAVSSAQCWLYSLTHVPGAALPLAEALSSDGLTWEASPEVTSFSLGGNGMAGLLLSQAGSAPRLYGLETTVTGPGVLTLRTRLRTAAKARLLLDGVPFSLGVPGEVDTWTASEVNIPSGPHTITIAPPEAVPGNAAPGPLFLLLDEAVWLPQQSVPFAEAVDAPGLTFSTGGVAAWGGAGTGSHDYARAANLGSGQSAWLETTVTGPGLLSFEFTIAGNEIYPQFLRDGAELPVSFVKTNWCDIPSGTHTLRWSLRQSVPYGGAFPTAGQRATLDALTWVAYNPQPLEAWSEGQGFSLAPSSSHWQTVAGPDINGGGSLHTGIPSWLDATVTGPAAFSFSVFSIGLQYPNYITLTVDGGARTLKLSNPPGGTGWTEHTVLIPAGIHAIRWTTPPLDHPLVWLDNFRLVPASTEIGAALEMPEAAWTGVGPRQWFTVSGAEWHGGSAVTAEHGFEWDYVWDAPPPGLEAVLPGPGRLSIPIRSTIRPSISINGHRDWPVTWTNESGGWSTVRFATLPGTNTLLIAPAPSWPEREHPLHMDHATWEPLAAPSFADLFPLAGAVWSTGPENPFRPVADSLLVAQPSAVCNLLPGAPGGWLEVSLTGPGTLGFSTLALLWGAQCQVLVDGQPMSAASGDMQESTSTHLGFFPAREKRYQLSLPHGPHTVRWSIPGVSQWRSPVLATLHSFTFTASSGFSGVVTEGSLPFFHGDAAPPQFLTEGGVPFVRILPRTVDEPYWQTLLSSRVTGPGLLRFRWRTAPNMLPQTGIPYLNLWIPGINPDDVIVGNIPGEAAAVGSHALGLTTTWREMHLFIPAGVTHLQWQLPRIGSLDLAGISFTPGSPLAVATALGQPGAQLTMDPLRPWTGWELPDGTRLVTPPPVSTNQWNILQLEMTVTGPVIMEWDDWARPDGEYGTTWLDGEECFGWPLSPWTPPPPWPSTSPPVRAGLAIPEGQHQFRWILPRLPFGQRNGIGEVTFRPVTAVYAAWRPPFPGYAPGEGPPTAPHPLVDGDSDGLSNLEEFTWRTDPYHFSLPPQPLTAIEAGHLTLCLPEPRPLSDGVRVYIETSSDFITWQRAAAELLPAPPAGQVKYRLTDPVSSGPRRYARTGVEFVE